MNNIDHILNHYFDGTSTAREEKIAKAYFQSDQVAPQHEIYKPLFALFEQEKETLIAPLFIIPKDEEKRKRPTSHPLWIASASIAAVMLLGIILFPFKGIHETQRDYVVIVNGERIANPQKAKEYAVTMFTQAGNIKKESYQPMDVAKEMQEKYNAAGIINEVKYRNNIQPTLNHTHIKN